LFNFVDNFVFVGVVDDFVPFGGIFLRFLGEGVY
jgi:hypothetical protein